MSLTEKDIIKLDWQSEYGATLETHELLEVLAKIAEDPEAYTWAEFDAGYTRAEQLANALRGMMGGLRAAEIAKTFKRAVKAREACEKYGLVPMATLEHAQQQLRAVGAMNVAIEARAATMAPGADQIGPGYPEPPPPPPTKALEPWTGEGLYVVAKERETGSKGVWSSQNEYQQSLWNMAARVANERMGIKAP